MNQKKWPAYVWLKGTAPDSRARGKKAERLNGLDIRVKSFDLHIGAGQKLLDNAEIDVTYGTRYGIIGRNGIGKSVLLRAISQREGPFSVIPDWYTILHVEQEIVGNEQSPLAIVLSSDRERLWLLSEADRLESTEEEDEDEEGYTLDDIYERLREIEAHKAESRASAILAGLQFDAEEARSKPSKEFSGGWRMRIALARALFMAPELLILDEPSNHLDLSAAIWLENYLSTYKKTLLLVSHDESMLNECVDNIIHFFDRKLYSYRGNYSAYLIARDQRWATDVKKRHAQDIKIRAARQTARNNTGTKLGARKRDEVKQIIKDRVAIVMEERAPSFNFPAVVGGSIETAVIKFDNVTYGYTPNSPVVKGLTFGLYMDSRVALVGANGAGKSTIMKLMSGELSPDSGCVTRNPHLRFVKYDQHAEESLDPAASCVEWLEKCDKHADFDGDYRKLLGRFGLHGHLPLQRIETLSGGQKARLVFAEIALRGPHLLLLDEPTNHLDIFAIEALIEGLKAYGGGLVIISHNTQILSQCCTQVCVVSGDSVDRFNGTFDQYKESVIKTL